MTDGHTARTGAMRGALRAIAHGRNELGIVLEPSETMRIAREALEDKLEQHMTIDAEVIKRHRDTIALAIGRHWRDLKAKPDDDALVDLFGPCADAVVNALEALLAEANTPAPDDDKIVEAKVSRLDDCCSAARPCSHQKRDPYSLCDVCEKAFHIAHPLAAPPTWLGTQYMTPTEPLDLDGWSQRCDCAEENGDPVTMGWRTLRALIAAARQLNAVTAERDAALQACRVAIRDKEAAGEGERRSDELWRVANARIAALTALLRETVEGLKKIRHSLTTLHNLRSTALSQEQIESFMLTGKRRSELEWMTDATKELDVVDTLIAKLTEAIK